MNFFYIILRNGSITEIEYNQEKYVDTLKAWSDNKRLVINPYGSQIPIGLNGADITQILPSEGYINYIDTAQPSKYILKGSWYDKKGDLIRHEEWKQKTIEEKKKLQLAERPQMTPEETEIARKRIAQMMKDAGWGK